MECALQYDFDPAASSNGCTASILMSPHRPEDHLENLLDVDDVAAMLKLHPRTVTRMACARRIPSVRLPGTRLWRFRRPDIEQWIQTNVLPVDDPSA